MADEKKVLVIDDNPEILEMIRLVLKNEGLKVIDSENGVLGLELARKEKPDLIILDIMLPEMSGFKLCRILKGEGETKHIPIVVLTALNDQETKQESLASYADDYLPKPVDRKTIVSKVRKFLNPMEEKA